MGIKSDSGLIYEVKINANNGEILEVDIED
ncbi:hypothetical protein [Clostridium kluyveri]